MGPLSCGIAKTALPRLTCFQVQGTNLSFTSLAPYWDRSTSEPVVSKVGKSWNSTWARSGSLLALIAVYNLLYSVGPDPTLASLTWMLGWLLFQSATDLSIPVTQDQKVKFTGPLEVLLLPELEPPPQAARGAKISSAMLTMAIWSATRRIQGKEE